MSVTSQQKRNMLETTLKSVYFPKGIKRSTIPFDLIAECFEYISFTCESHCITLNRLSHSAKGKKCISVVIGSRQYRKYMAESRFLADGIQNRIIMLSYYEGLDDRSKELETFNEWCINGNNQNRMIRSCKRIKSVRNGMFKEWYGNGQLRMSCEYKKGKFDGEFKLWYDNGQLKSRCSYKENKLHGKSMKWYSNGQLGSSVVYRNGCICTY